MAEESQGFFGRWSRRKQDVREGRPLPEPAIPAVHPEPVEGSAGQLGSGLRPAQPERREGGAAVPPAAGQPAQAVEPPAPPPTMEDVQALTAQSDYTRFMASEVDPEVKNAAMRKLFADPHFNVMDGLDIYIDDYNKPDPLPQSMLRQMASAKFLKLFDDEKKEDSAPPDGVAASAPVAAADAAPAAAPAVEPDRTGLMTEDHDHTDLRLQQDHAAGPQGPGRGPQ